MAASDFDFVIGRWDVTNRKRDDMLDPQCTDWTQFRSTGEHRPLPGGAGNIEAYATHEMPGLGEFHGLALRLYEPSSDLWRIWWSSSASPGRLDPPVEGRFDGPRGDFRTHDVINGVPVGVRFLWDDLGPTQCRWQQAFSHDGDRTWDTNWVMEMSRQAAPVNTDSNSGMVPPGRFELPTFGTGNRRSIP